MGKTNFIFALFAFSLILLVSSASGQVLFNVQPNNLYNLGDMVQTAVGFSPTSDCFNSFLICNGVTTQINLQCLDGVQDSLKVITPPLNSTLVGGSVGTCKIEAVIGNERKFSSSFTVSNKINVNITTPEREFKPGQQVLIQGNAEKENGRGAKGAAQIAISSGNRSAYSGTAMVSNGFFQFNFSIPSDLAAGTYTAVVQAYELNSLGTKTNIGASSFNVKIDQVPTSLEIIFGNQTASIMPGKTLRVRTILHDQTGEKINAVADFTVKDESGQVMDQQSKNTGEFLELPIAYNSPPATWSVSAVSRGLNSSSSFNILSNEAVSVDFLNRTLIVKNVGNVPYDKKLLVDLGNESSSFNVSLGVDKTQKYVLSAPDGNYSVQVSSGNSNLFNGNLALTGNAISVEQASSGIVSLVKYPLVWIFIVLILAFVIFLLFRRIRKKKFFGKANINKAKPKVKPSKEERLPVQKDGIVDKSSGRADMSLSIQGDKQDASVVCVNLKNLEEIRSGKGGVNETMDKLQQSAVASKSVIYENGNYLFFIFAPVKTRTFSNEKPAVQTAREISKIFESHNKLFKQRIDFGISVNRGTIVAKKFGDSIKFMSLGNFSSVAKKLASISKGEILLSRDVREHLMSDVKTEKAVEGDMDYYTLLEVKDRSSSEKFINDFMKKMEREKREHK